MFKKYSYVPQIDMRDCGVAALASIIQHYGSYYSLARLRQLAHTNMEGTSALGILTAAESLGFETQAVQADMSLFDMEGIPFPFIVHVNKKHKLPHYYVVYGMTTDKIIIGDPDPAVKIIKMPKKQFAAEWTGTTLFMAPSEDYTVYKEEKHDLLDFIPKLKKHTALVSKIIFFSALISIISIVGSYYLQELLDDYIPNQMYSALNIITLGLTVSYMVQQIIFYLKSYALERLNIQMTSELFLNYLEHILNLPMEFFTTRRTGEIISRFTDATTIIDALASTLLSLFLDITVLLAMGGVMFFQNQRLFLITISIIPIYILVIFLFIPLFYKMNNAVMHENAKLNSALIDDINGIETIKSLSIEHHRFNYLSHRFSQSLSKSLTLTRYEFLQQALKQALQLVLNTLVLWLGASQVIAQELSIGQLITYTTLLVYFITPLENILSLQTTLQAAKVANNRLNEVYLVESEHNHHLEDEPKKIPSFDGLEIKNLTYQYGLQSPTLKNINLTITPGQKVCFVGTSGSGKSTLAKLLVRFFEPNSGDIRISGQNIKTVDKKSLRQLITYLPQHPYLFSGSILDNLTLGLTDVSEKEILSACQTADILSDILDMPQQFQTEVCDGATLSGGQKQRLALARALLTQSPVLILDESTSNLDPLTEQRILTNLLQQTDKTIIFIAHRLAIAEQVHYIYVLDQGNIVEEGLSADLLAKRGTYFKLFKPSF